MPRDLEPMLATAATGCRATTAGHTRSSGTGSGRSLTSPAGGLRISARRGADHTPRYPELTAIVERLAGARRSSTARSSPSTSRDGRAFSSCNAAWGSRTRRRSALRAAETPATYVAFDLLWLDGRPLIDAAVRGAPRALAGLELRRPELAGAGAPRRRGRAALGRDPRARARGDRREAARQPYRPGQTQPRVAQGPLPARPGAGDRRLDARRGSRGGAGRLAAGRPLGRDARRRRSGSDARSSSSTPAASAPASPRRRSTRLTGALEPLRRDDSPFELGEDPEVKYAPASPRPRRRPGLGRAGAGLRGRVHRVDPRGHPASVGVQGPARRQGSARGGPRELSRLASDPLSHRARPDAKRRTWRASFLSRRPMRKEPAGSLR